MRAMSNLETVRSFYSGAAAGDLDAIVQMRQYTDTALVHAAWK